MEKLSYYGISGSTNRWIKDFISNGEQAVVIEGQKSCFASATFGVPQGSFMGPCLFLLYINDLPAALSSRVWLFADDTIAYLTVTSERDAQGFQKDLDKMGKWEEDWQMEFHPDKCKALTVTRKKNPIKFSYKLHGIVLERVSSTQYLGPTLTNLLDWNVHIDNFTNKANESLALLKRNFRIKNVQSKSVAYSSVVRPHLEYAGPIWDPYVKKNIDELEMIQRRAASNVLNR